MKSKNFQMNLFRGKTAVWGKGNCPRAHFWLRHCQISNYIKVRPKASRAGFVCRTGENTGGHLKLWKEKLLNNTIDDQQNEKQQCQRQWTKYPRYTSLPNSIIDVPCPNYTSRLMKDS